MDSKVPAYRDNSAGRLRSILQQARSCEPSGQALWGWSTVFGRQYPGERLKLMRDMVETALLPAAIREELRLVPWQERVHLETSHFKLDGVHIWGRAEVHPSVDRTLNNYYRLEEPNMTMGLFLDPLDADALRQLRVCEAVLQTGRPVQTVNAQALDELSRLLSEAMAIVRSTDGLEPSLRELLRERLIYLQGSVDLFRIRGSREVQFSAEALAAVAGNRTFVPKTPREVAKRLAAVLAAVTLVTGAVTSPFELLEHIRSALPAGSEQNDPLIEGPAAGPRPSSP